MRAKAMYEHGILFFLLKYVTTFMYPYLFVCFVWCGCCRSESAAVPSPHHLAWLTIETYKTLFPDDKVQQTHSSTNTSEPV